jgi:hypothetical protein
MNTCPYCNVDLTHTPKRRTACPSCHRPILVRKGKLCTEEEARALDYCSPLGIEPLELYRTREELSAEFGRRAGYGDTAWRLMHSKLEKTRDWNERSGIYWHMSRFLWDEKKDYLHVRQQAVRMTLESYKKDVREGLLDPSEWRFTIISDETSCPECRQLHNQLFTFEEFAQTLPLPVADCIHEKTVERQRGWCRCTLGLKRLRP